MHAAGTVEGWCEALIHARTLEGKLQPEPCPAAWSQPPPSPHRIPAPGRPADWKVVERSPKTPRPGALVRPETRAQLLHTFLHHELQAAELMAWAVLAFPETPIEYRRGLLGILEDELRHARMYLGHLGSLGFEFGAFPVRDWFWQRVATVDSPAAFCAVMGMGFEGANLEHTANFAARFRTAGDEVGARLQERVGLEEEAHVRFASTWFERFTGSRGFDQWREHLPEPLTPTVMGGRPLARDARERAGMDADFLDQLEAWNGCVPGS